MSVGQQKHINVKPSTSKTLQSNMVVEVNALQQEKNRKTLLHTATFVYYQSYLHCIIQQPYCILNVHIAGTFACFEQIVERFFNPTTHLYCYLLFSFNGTCIRIHIFRYGTEAYQIPTQNILSEGYEAYLPCVITTCPFP